VARRSTGQGFGARVRERREELHRTQKEVADQIGIGVRAVAAWENDEWWPSKLNRDRLAAVLRTTVGWLETGVEKDRKPMMRGPSLSKLREIEAFVERYEEMRDQDELSESDQADRGDWKFPPRKKPSH
jgi:transcriptional regulator with XRE-family HTH domain